MSTTAMTEMLFITTFTGGIYFLLKWIKEKSLTSLIFSALFIFLTSINRYEGWPIVISSIFTIALIALVKRLKVSQIESIVIIFSVLAFAGIAFWLIWNGIIFGDPLYFLNSIYSSKLQTQAGYHTAGTQSVLLYHHLLLSSLGYLYAVIANSGVIITIAGIIGILVCLLSLPFSNKNNNVSQFYLIVFLLITPYLFEVYAVYKGNVPLNVPELTHSLFNIRLGMYCITSLTILILLALKKFNSNLIKISILSIIIMIQLILFLPKFTFPITLQSANEGIIAKIQTAKWLRTHYAGGKVLASSASGDPLLFDSGLDLKEFIDDGSSSLFNSALKYPQNYANYIIVSDSPVDKQRDLVYITLSKNQKWKKYYKEVFKNNAFIIFQRKT